MELSAAELISARKMFVIWRVHIQCTQVVLENSGRSDDHDLPFARASTELTNVMCEILKVGEPRMLAYCLTFVDISIHDVTLFYW